MIRNPNLYVEGHFERILYPLNLSLTLNLTPLSTASMTLQEGDFLPPRSYVELFSPYGSEGYYRVRNPQSSYGNTTTTCELEHMISEVGDYLYSGDKIDEMQNAATAVKTIWRNGYKGRLWALGDVEALRSGDDVAVQVDRDSVLEAILSILEQKPDVCMTFDFYNQRTWVVNFAKKPTTVTAEGRLTRNLSSAKVSYDDTDLCTRVYYKKYKTENNKTTSEWYYADDGEAQADYGLVEKTVSTSSDMTDDEIKTTWKTYLREHRKPKVSVEISAIELAQITGAPQDIFTLGKMCRLAIPDYGVTIERNISCVSWSDMLNDPDHFTVQMGDEEDTVVTYLHNLDSSGSGSSSGGSSKKKTTTGINDATDTANNAIYRLKLDPPPRNSNQYSLYKMAATDTGWVLVGNFSRAVTSWTVEAASGTIKVTAHPQEQTKNVLVKAASGNWSGNTYKGNIQYSSNDGSSWTNTGKQYQVDATTRYNAGWDAAAYLVVMPVAGSNDSFEVKIPVKTTTTGGVVVRSQSTKTLHITTDSTPSSSGYAYVTYLGQKVAKKSIGGWWNKGWDDAAEAVVMPEAGSNDSFDVKIPVTTTTTGGAVDRTQSTKTLHITTDSTPSSSGYAYVTYLGQKVAKKSIGNWWNAGWDDAAEAVVMPEAGTGSSFVVKIPVTTTTTGGVVDRTQSTKTLSLTTDNTPSSSGYAYVTYLGQNVAKKSIGSWWNAGWDAAAGVVVMPEAGTGGSFVVKVPVTTTTTGGVVDRTQSTKTFSLETSGEYAYAKYLGQNVARKQISHSIASFAVTAPNGAVSGSYTNNSSGYYISGTGYNPTIGTVLKGTWTCDGISKTGNANALLTAMPKAVYQNGWKNAANAMVWPTKISGATTKSSMTITYPTSTGTTTKTFTLSKDSGGAYLKSGSDIFLRVT